MLEMEQLQQTQAMQNCLEAAQDDQFKQTQQNLNKSAGLIQQKDEIEAIY
jgi:hypothetical protein